MILSNFLLIWVLTVITHAPAGINTEGHISYREPETNQFWFQRSDECWHEYRDWKRRMEFQGPPAFPASPPWILEVKMCKEDELLNDVWPQGGS